MKRSFIHGCAAAVLLLSLPLLGVWLAGHPMDRYLEFPPGGLYVEHAAFSWPVFWALAGIQLIAIAAAIRATRRGSGGWPVSARRPLPWWGWAAVAWTAVWWILAWNRWPWFEPWQRHTFTPLWLGYVVCVNALAVRASGRCLLTESPAYLAKLFPLSAAFWWFFEYLNRFVQNWTYQGVEGFGAGEYFLFATASFSTVLPAVISTADLLRVWGVAHRADDRPCRAPPARTRWALAGLSVAALLGLGIYPNLLFPFLWLAPLGVVLMFQSLENFPRIFPTIGTFLRLSLAALICGFFWECWNFHSVAKWVYHVPFVQRFHVFEMPLLGYFGYLPFGWECAMIAGLIKRKA